MNANLGSLLVFLSFPHVIPIEGFSIDFDGILRCAGDELSLRRGNMVANEV